MIWKRKKTRKRENGARPWSAWAKATTLTVLIALAPSTYACSCAQPDRATAFNHADEVVGGEVSGVHEEGGLTWTRLAVGKRWKGGTSTELLLRTDGPCGYALEKDRPYLVFARTVGNNRFYVSQCSGTQPFGKSQALIRQLEALGGQ